MYTGPVKRFLVFGFPEYGEDYGGGWDDLIGQYDTLEEVLAKYPKPRSKKKTGSMGWHFIQIVDTTTSQTVEKY